MKQPAAGNTNPIFSVLVLAQGGNIGGDASVIASGGGPTTRGDFSDWGTLTKFAKGSFYSNDMILSAIPLYNPGNDTTVILTSVANVNPVAKLNISADLVIDVMLIPPD